MAFWRAAQAALEVAVGVVRIFPYTSHHDVLCTVTESDSSKQALAILEKQLDRCGPESLHCPACPTCPSLDRVCPEQFGYFTVFVTFALGLTLGYIISAFFKITYPAPSAPTEPARLSLTDSTPVATPSELRRLGLIQ